MSFNQRMRELLETATVDLSRRERRSVKQASDYFNDLDDQVLAEVTRQAVCACAFRLAVNRDEVNASPTPELFKQAMNDTLKLIQKSVDDDF
jgi:hypothetical protein